MTRVKKSWWSKIGALCLVLMTVGRSWAYAITLGQKIGTVILSVAIHAGFLGFIYVMDTPPKQLKQPARVIFECRDYSRPSKPKTYAHEIIHEAQTTFQLYGVGGVQELAAQTIAQNSTQPAQLINFAVFDIPTRNTYGNTSTTVLPDCKTILKAADAVANTAPSGTLQEVGAVSQTINANAQAEWNDHTREQLNKSIQGILTPTAPKGVPSGQTLRSTGEGLFSGTSYAKKNGTRDKELAREQQYENELYLIHTNPLACYKVGVAVGEFTAMAKKMVYGNLAERVNALLHIGDCGLDGNTYGAALRDAQNELYKAYCHTDGSICMEALLNMSSARDIMMKYNGVKHCPGVAYDHTKDFVAEAVGAHRAVPCNERWENSWVWGVKPHAVYESPINQCYREMLTAFVSGNMVHVRQIKEGYHNQAKKNYHRDDVTLLHQELQKAFNQQMRPYQDEYGLFHFTLPADCQDPLYASLSDSGRAHIARDTIACESFNNALLLRHTKKCELRNALNIPMAVQPIVHQAMYSLLGAKDASERIDIIHAFEQQSFADMRGHKEFMNAFFLPNGLTKDFARNSRARSLTMSAKIVSKEYASVRKLLNHAVHAESTETGDTKSECTHVIDLIQRLMETDNELLAEYYLAQALNSWQWVCDGAQGERASLQRAEHINCLQQIIVRELNDNKWSFLGSESIGEGNASKVDSSPRPDDDSGDYTNGGDSNDEESDCIRDDNYEYVIQTMRFMEQAGIDPDAFYDFYGTPEQNDLHERMGDFLVAHAHEVVIPGTEKINPVDYLPQIAFQQCYGASFDLNRAGLTPEGERMFEICQETPGLIYLGKQLVKSIGKCAWHKITHPAQTALEMIETAIAAKTIALAVTALGFTAPATLPAMLAVKGAHLAYRSWGWYQEWCERVEKLHKKIKNHNDNEVIPLTAQQEEILRKLEKLDFYADVAGRETVDLITPIALNFGASKVSAAAMENPYVRQVVQNGFKFGRSKAKNACRSVKDGFEQSAQWVDRKRGKNPQAACAGMPGVAIDVNDKTHGLAMMSESSQQSGGENALRPSTVSSGSNPWDIPAHFDIKNDIKARVQNCVVDSSGQCINEQNMVAVCHDVDPRNFNEAKRLALASRTSSVPKEHASGIKVTKKYYLHFHDRHSTDYWDGSVKLPCQTFFSPDTNLDDLMNQFIDTYAEKMCHTLAKKPTEKLKFKAPIGEKLYMMHIFPNKEMETFFPIVIERKQ